MTVIARRIAATPARSASAAWKIIVDLISEAGTESRTELESVAGIACSLVSDETLADAPAVVCGTGPRLKIYCLYDDDAMNAEQANENALTFNPTDGDWKMSLPCASDDLDWVQGELKTKSNRITARDKDAAVENETEARSAALPASALELDRGVFLKS